MKLKTILWDGGVATCYDVPSLVIGTHGQGEITCAYSLLVAAFGEPDAGDGYKTQAEWIINTPDGIATLYDWKQGDSYLGKGNGTPVEQITQWSIGGYNEKVIAWIRKAIRQ
jgi:hypothetical protein